jgi:IS30 family transposase
MAGCSGQQIAAVLGVHPQTLYDGCKREKEIDFSNYSLEKKEKGDAALLGKQFEKALKGDNTQLVWLGKNRLRQTDKLEQRVNHQTGVKIYLPDNGMTSDVE